MIKTRYLLAVALATGVVVVSMPAALQSQSQPATASRETPPKNHKTHGPDSNPTEDDGQRVFDQHCSRCHNAPEGFSPRISGTVVRHMRVRAALSQHEEEQLLHFFNP
jgi:cytochrome c5